MKKSFLAFWAAPLFYLLVLLSRKPSLSSWYKNHQAPEETKGRLITSQWTCRQPIVRYA